MSGFSGALRRLEDRLQIRIADGLAGKLPDRSSVLHLLNDGV